MKEFIIVRSRWIKGEIRKNNYLTSNYLCQEDEEGKMHYDAVGFYLKACKVSKHDLLDQASSADLYESIPKQAKWLLDEDEQDSEDAVAIQDANDDASLKWNTREGKIRAIFTRHDVKVTFVN